MKRWALIVDGEVANVVEQQTAPGIGGVWVECTGQPVGPGAMWDGAAFEPAPAPTFKFITAAAFWDRFTNGELVDYDVAMQHDPAASGPAKKAAAKLRIFRRELSDAGKIKLGPKVVAFVASLETAILTAGRAAVITGTPISADESADR